MIPRKLYSVFDKSTLVEHLCSLQGEDRRLRFGGTVSNNYITEYVEASWENGSTWFGYTMHSRIIAACHVAIDKEEAELGCSVDPEYRGYGLAQSMFDRAVTYLRSHNITKVYMHCLTENQIMRHIARKNDMTLVSCYGESDARVEVEPPTAMTALKDAYLDRMAMYDMLIRSQAEVYNSVLENLTNGAQKVHVSGRD